MSKKERLTKLEKLTAEQWRLAEAMDKAESVFQKGMIMIQLNNVTMDIYYEEMRLDGKTKAQAKKELFELLEKSGFKYAEQIKAIA